MSPHVSLCPGCRRPMPGNECPCGVKIVNGEVIYPKDYPKEARRAGL